MNELGAVAILGIRERPKLADNFVSHKMDKNHIPCDDPAIMVSHYGGPKMALLRLANVPMLSLMAPNGQ